MSCHTSLQVGGPAALYVVPKSIDELGAALDFCHVEGLPIFILGFGTNLLVSDDGFAGCVISLRESCREWSVNEETVYAGAGLNGAEVVKLCAAKGLSGLELNSGLPGSLGGWLRMNAGAFRFNVSERVTRIKVVNYQGNEGWISREGVGFVYRDAPGLRDYIVAGVEFEMTADRPSEVQARVKATIRERYRRGIMALPSAGSVFRNPEDGFAAKMLDAVGCKSLTRGGARVSPRHVNIIITSPGASALDVVGLIREMRALVEKQFGLRLEREIKELGFSEEI